jgi:hypothetical protein
MIHMQDVSALGAAQSIPSDIIAAARAMSTAQRVEANPVAPGAATRRHPMQPCPPHAALVQQPRGHAVPEESSSCAASQNFPPQKLPTLMPPGYTAANAADSRLATQRRARPEGCRDGTADVVKRVCRTGNLAPEGSCASTPYPLPTVRIGRGEEKARGTSSQGAASLMPTQQYTPV